MDLTAAIRSKIDSLRTTKTIRYNALSLAVEREVAVLTHRSAQLFTKLEDALEADTLGKSEDADNLNGEEVEKEGIVEEEEEKVEEQTNREKHSETVPEVYDVDDDVKDMYYGTEIGSKYYDPRTDERAHYDSIETQHPSTSLYAGIRPPSRNPSVSSKAQQKKAEESSTTAPT